MYIYALILWLAKDSKAHTKNEAIDSESHVDIDNRAAFDKPLNCVDHSVIMNFGSKTLISPIDDELINQINVYTSVPKC